MTDKLKELYTGIGKRKTSVAKILLVKGSGMITINHKPLGTFFNGLNEELEIIKLPLILTNLNNQYDITGFVNGGGVSSQIEAIQLGISKAVCQIDTEYRQTLNQYLLLRRDSRIKERRKYGLKKARKASQYSKR